jgi:hypothetical protein
MAGNITWEENWHNRARTSGGQYSITTEDGRVRPKHVLIEFKKGMCYIDRQKNKYSVLNECNKMLKYNILLREAKTKNKVKNIYVSIKCKVVPVLSHSSTTPWRRMECSIAPPFLMSTPVGVNDHFHAPSVYHRERALLYELVKNWWRVETPLACRESSPAFVPKFHRCTN